MLVGLMVITFYLSQCSSLKEKRQIIRSIIEKTSHKFRISIVESNYQDLHQSAEITLSILASTTAQGDSILDNILNYIEGLSSAEITEVLREYR